MIVRPVIVREMAQAARRKLNYYLRSLGALAVLLACLAHGSETGFAAASGGPLFGFLHLIMFSIIWLVVPFVTADCISHERREGTIGLLFLTQLSARDIVIAKGFAEGLRGAALWLAVVPVLIIPVLIGGVDWRETMLSIGINFGSLCLAIAAGLLASAWSKVRVRAMVLAAFFGGTLLGLWSVMSGQLLWSAVFARRFGMSGSAVWSGLAGVGFLGNLSGIWEDYVRLARVSQLMWGLGQLVLLSLLMLIIAIWLAGARTHRSWQDLPPSNAQRWFDRVFCTPVLWLGLFRGWMRRKLERNPIGWLEQRRWSGRLVTWSWLAVLISIYSAILMDNNFYRHSTAMQRPLAWLLVGSMAMSAAGSFRRERENGVMELLLVSPMREEEIVWGRVRGLWGQFGPATVLLLGLWTYFAGLFRENAGASVWSAGLTLLALPVIGLYFSLRCRSFVVAFALTVAAGIVAPRLVPTVLRGLEWMGMLYYGPGSTGSALPPEIAWILVWTCQVLVAYWCWLGLVRKLRKRSFPMEVAAGI